MSLTITECALTKAKEFRTKLNKPDDWGMCVSLRGGGCSGFMYDIDFIAPPDDPTEYKVVENEGMTLYCDKKSYIFLLGTEIDYEESMMSSGFRFNTPQATAKCGCGESVGF